MSNSSWTVALRDYTPAEPATVYASQEFGVATAVHEGGEWKYLSNEDGTFGVPLILRSVPGTSWRDAVTPYGYGGVHLDESLSDEQVRGLWNLGLNALRDSGIVSVFLRFPPFIPSAPLRLAGVDGIEISNPSSTIAVSCETSLDLLEQMTSSCRKNVRRAKRDGLWTRVSDANDESLARFQQLYRRTMDRLGAAKTYYFDSAYYRELLHLGPDRVKILDVLDSHEQQVASSLVLLDKTVAHQHLSGSIIEVKGANNARVYGLLEWAQSNGFSQVHLGGGTKEGDSLFRFKQSFGGSVLEFNVGKIVILPDEYDELCRLREAELDLALGALSASTFFPAYRAPVPESSPDGELP